MRMDIYVCTDAFAHAHHSGFGIDVMQVSAWMRREYERTRRWTSILWMRSDMDVIKVSSLGSRIPRLKRLKPRLIQEPRLDL